LTKADLVLHGHHHRMGAESTPGMAPIVLAPSLGNPSAGRSADLDNRDGLALLRLEPTISQVFYFTHRPPSSGEAMRFEPRSNDGGLLIPDQEIDHSVTAGEGTPSQ
jgi:hypothetical protein